MSHTSKFKGYADEQICLSQGYRKTDLNDSMSSKFILAIAEANIYFFP